MSRSNPLNTVGSTHTSEPSKSTATENIWNQTDPNLPDPSPGDIGDKEAGPDFFAYTPINNHEPAERQYTARSLASRNTWACRFWLWEFLSLLIATIALLAIIVTLVTQQDRPQPLQPSVITTNARIAIFSAVLKACLGLPIVEGISQLKWLWFRESRPLQHLQQWDSASRGTWGSLLLIFQLRGRHLAAFGAALMLLSLAIDPFAQQIVQYYSCSIVAPGENATFPFSNVYANGIVSARLEAPPDADAQVQVAFYTGLLNPPANVSSVISYSCRTGNCTFPATEDGAMFSTLALGSRCVDVSSTITLQTTADDVTTATLAAYNLSLSTSGKTNDVMLSGYKYAGDNPSSYYIKIAFLISPFMKESNAHAFECEFYPSVDTYSASVTNGVLVESRLDSQRMDVWPVTYGTFSLLIPNRTIVDGKWEECKSSPNSSTEYSVSITPATSLGDPVTTLSSGGSFPVVGSKVPTANTRWWPQSCVYYLPYGASGGFESRLIQFLGGESLYFEGFSQSAIGNLWSVNLWGNNGNTTLDSVQTAMNGLTYSISAQWRQGDGTNNTRSVVGDVLEVRTCLRARWGWIALPAALLFLTTIFLISAIVRTSLDNGLVWKSSILPLLFAGLDARTRRSAGVAVGLGEMSTAATAATVQLRQYEDGFHLVSSETDCRE